MSSSVLLLDQLLRDRDALALAARQLHRIVVGALAEPEPREQLRRLVASRSASRLMPFITPAVTRLPSTVRWRSRM